MKLKNALLVAMLGGLSVAGAGLVTGNPGVGSFARRDSCHTTAANGIYDEHQVRIPGAGRWDDD